LRHAKRRDNLRVKSMTGKARTRGQNRMRGIHPFAGSVAAGMMGMLILLCWPIWLRAQQVVQPQAPTQKETGGEPASPIESRLPTSAYRIAPGDLLDVYVVAVPELSRTYRVSPSGGITLPMLDHPIIAEGLSPDELSEAISTDLRQEGLVSHPDVVVFVKSSPLNSVAVTGSVLSPGMYPVYGETTIVDVLSQAGGLAPDAGSTAIVIRGGKTTPWAMGANKANPKGSGKITPRIIKVPIRQLLDTGDQGQNIPIFPGDRIEVPRSGIIYVVGAVNRAGGFAMTGEQNHLTVLQAIALAGNVTRTAVTKRAIILRKDPKALAGHEQIDVNLKDILSGKAPDQPLMADDILFVPDSTGKRVLTRAIALATSVAIYRVPF